MTREDLARALAAALKDVASPSLEEVTTSDLRAFWVQGSINLEEVTAALLDRLYEPDEGMLEVAGPAIDDYYTGSKDAPFDGSVRAAWQAMIDVVRRK